MPALDLVPTLPASFRPGPVSAPENAAMFRAALNLFVKWGLTDEQAAALLGLTTSTFRRWKSEGPGRINRDGSARLSNLMGIHKALRIIFTDPQRGYDWVRAANTTFEGRTALDVMLDGDLTDLMRVRRCLDAERGGW
jgi:Protein of unknown function (DUF2384)